MNQDRTGYLVYWHLKTNLFNLLISCLSRMFYLCLKSHQGRKFKKEPINERNHLTNDWSRVPDTTHNYKVCKSHNILLLLKQLINDFLSRLRIFHGLLLTMKIMLKAAVVSMLRMNQDILAVEQLLLKALLVFRVSKLLNRETSCMILYFRNEFKR